MANLMLRELASDGFHLTASTRKIMNDIIMEVDMILQEGLAAGVFKEARTFIAYIIMVGSMNIFTSTQKMRKQFQGKSDAFGFALSQQEAAAEISGIVLNGLLTRG
jgi:hypothetical protein